ncbi:hypothetical protein [Halobacillus faecis]|uniref:Uncharacterized protein n=1 Tax=Halobacillus faecis TaxID=360184 RepID=A0A511WTP5_9BACI|nr:hypothetical protein [Halobacillus faecis]GEN54544.1 hypothetical protein HFA01_28060 [Halobacillus faecis]
MGDLIPFPPSGKEEPEYFQEVRMYIRKMREARSRAEANYYYNMAKITLRENGHNVEDL